VENEAFYFYRPPPSLRRHGLRHRCAATVSAIDGGGSCGAAMAEAVATHGAGGAGMAEATAHRRCAVPLNSE